MGSETTNRDSTRSQTATRLLSRFNSISQQRTATRLLSATARNSFAPQLTSNAFAINSSSQLVRIATETATRLLSTAARNSFAPQLKQQNLFCQYQFSHLLTRDFFFYAILSDLQIKLFQNMRMPRQRERVQFRRQIN